MCYNFMQPDQIGIFPIRLQARIITAYQVSFCRNSANVEFWQVYLLYPFIRDILKTGQLNLECKAILILKTKVN